MMLAACKETQDHQHLHDAQTAGSYNYASAIMHLLHHLD
jgi:hypothetical protein